MTPVRSIDRTTAIAMLALALPLIPWAAQARADESAAAAARNDRVEKLLDSMTLAEKLGQLTQMPGGKTNNPAVAEEHMNRLGELIRSGGVGSLLGATGAEYTNKLQRVAVEETRLKIPLILGNDVIHGYRTIFPIPLAESCSWNPDLIEEASHVAAVEAAAAGTHWTFAPMVDVCRDPRWGRIAEGAGEDPFLGCAFSAARVRGFQGSDLSAPDTVLACAKHFVAYGSPEGGRDYNTVDISIATLHNVHMPPFEAAVKAGVGSLMSAFNEINGVPASGNPYTLTEVLRNRWGFEGFVVSDWTSIEEMSMHGFGGDKAKVAELAIEAGVDMDMSSLSYHDTLADSLAANLVSLDTIDRAARRVLRAKIALGLFERPYADPEIEKRVTLCDSHREVARKVAQQSIVLLKNDGSLLPIRITVKSIAVIGPLATSQIDVIGTWSASGRAEEAVSVMQGISERVGQGTKLVHVPGCAVNDDDTSGIAAAVEAAKESDMAVLVVGESREMSGEAHCRSSLDLPGVQKQLVQAVHATGVPTVVVLMNGRPMSISWTAEHVPAIVEAWHLGVEHGHAVADVLFGDVNPSGKLTATFPRTVGQIPIYYAYKNTGRPFHIKKYHRTRYLDVPMTPLYPFGYGLSYTTFEYGDVSVSEKNIPVGGKVTVSADITNTGNRAADETVQCYIRQLKASLTRPVKQLRGFKRIHLEPGETKTVSFELSGEHLGFYNNQGEYVTEPATYNVWIAPHSAEGEAAQFDVVAN